MENIKRRFTFLYCGRQKTYESHQQIPQRVIGLCISAMLPFFGPPCVADIATDGMVGPARNLAGPDFSIGAELGATRGNNLFHSFRTFNIDAGESATFTGPGNIANVISRVTGGDASTLNGLLRSEVGQADFFFINPAGVVFGPNAQVDVPSAFHISTADELRFDDGTVYSATDHQASTLSIAQPESFGFLSPQPASITVNGSQLEFAPNSHTSMAAGNLTIQGGASLVSDGGDIQMTAIGESGNLVPLGASPEDSTGNGTIVITEFSKINVSGSGGAETVALRGGLVEVKDSEIAADHRGDQDSNGRILLDAESIRVANSDIHALVSGAGRGNDIIVTAKELEVDATTAPNGLSQLRTAVDFLADGSAGDVLVEAGRVVLTNGGKLSSNVGLSANGRGGSVTVHADSLYIDDGGVLDRSTGIETEVEFLATGDAGPVTVEVGGALEMVGGGVISSATSSDGAAGDVFVHAGSLHMDGNGESFTQIASNAEFLSDGNAGNVVVDVEGTMALRNGARIASDTFGSGNAGQVEVIAGELLIDGGDQTGITTEAHSGSSGSAGNIIVITDDLLEMRNQSKISALSFGGAAGKIQVHAARLRMVGSGDPTQLPTTIGADPNSLGGTAGSVNVQVDGRMELADGAWIFANNGDSTAGNVVIHAGELDMDGGGATAVIASLTVSSEGEPGSVDISVDGAMNLHSNSEVSATSITSGRGGDVVVQADSLRLDGGASEALITSEAYGTGPGGSVRLIVGGPLELFQGGVISTGAFSEGDGGNIDIRTGELYMANQGSDLFTGISSAANSGSSGAAGKINVHVDGPLTITDGSQILSSTFATGNAGGIDIETGSLHIDGTNVTDRFTGITSSAEPGSLGDSGPTTVVVHDRAELRAGGGISATTSAEGDAGDIEVRADSLLIHGSGAHQPSAISSEASVDATGNVGTIDIHARQLMLTDGGEVTITAAQTLPIALLATDPAGRIMVRAEDLQLDHGARITAESTGNVPASAIEIDARDLHMENSSEITTSSFEANGGPILIKGHLLILEDSLITTSVAGQNGNGGDITLAPEFLVMNGGFIQANTTAQGASGGDIFIDTKVLIASHGLLDVGNPERLTFQPGGGNNVIQAAAPGGEQGVITITSPELNIRGALVTLSTPFVDAPRLISDPCAAAAGQKASSLIQGGRGGIPAGPEDPAAVSFGGERLDQVLDDAVEKPVSTTPTNGASLMKPAPSGCRKGE